MKRVTPGAEVVPSGGEAGLSALREALAGSEDLAGLVGLEMLAPPEGVEGAAELVRRVALAVTVSAVAEGASLGDCLAAAQCSPAEWLEVSQTPELWPALTGWAMGLIVAPRFPGIMMAASMAAMTGDAKAQGLFMELVQMANERSSDAALEHVRRLSGAGLAEEIRGMMARLDGVAAELSARDGGKVEALVEAARKDVKRGATTRQERKPGVVKHEEIRDG